MDIKPSDKTVQNVLEGAFYKIPRFQRPYSWDKENVDDFWNDAIAADDPDYFIGSFVLYKESPNSDTYMVVDGQQRLATITLLLAAVRNAFSELGFDDLARGVQKLIEREDIENKMRFVLLAEEPFPFLQDYIQKFGPAELPKNIGSEEEALELAFNHLVAKVKSTIDSVDLDASISDKKKLDEKRKRLVHIRDKLLRLQLITVELDNEDDAYLIFETLNTRGKNLGVGDLVKNLLMRLLKASHEGLDIAREKWRQILRELDDSAADIHIDSFIFHSWLSRYPYLGKAKLFREIRRTVDKSNAKDFLDQLVEDVQLYRWIFEPKSREWPKNERDILRSLIALNLFRVVQPVPMTLSILREYTHGSLGIRQVRTILRKMEDFHVQFTAVTAQRTGGGTARMYAAAAEALLKSSDRSAKSKVLSDFIVKMKDRIPSFEEYEANFLEIGYHSRNTKQKPLVQYLLSRLDEHFRSGAIVDYSAMTIEHIAPESQSGLGGVSEHSVGLLGNLLLIPEDLNVKLADSDFDTKKKAYEEHSVPMDDVLRKASKWQDEEIIQRTKLLARISYDKVFKV